MRIAAFDPGGTTGYALLDVTKEDIKLVDWQQIRGGLDGFIDWHTSHWHDHDTLIVCEDFILRPGVHGADITPAFVIGAIKALNRDSQVNLQTASQKKLCDDSRLKRLGMYQRGNPHANDAIRHGIIYLRNIRHLPTLKKGWQ